MGRDPLTPGPETSILAQGGRARTPAPLQGIKWGAIMATLPNVLVAMQSIQAESRALGLLLELLGDEQLSIGGKERHGLCTDINNSIWEVANDYEKALPGQAQRFREA